MESSLPTLACLGLAAGDSEGVCNCLCFEGGTPSAVTTVSSWGDGVDRDRGLLLCIDDKDPDGVVYNELRARVRLPSIFCFQMSAISNKLGDRFLHLVSSLHSTRFVPLFCSELRWNSDRLLVQICDLL